MWRALSATVVLAACIARPALGAVDMTGAWKLNGGGGFGDFSNGFLLFSQTGTALTFSFPSYSEPPVGSTGTIDPDTGVFSTRMDFIVFYVSTCTAYLDGVASADGLSFTATYFSDCPYDNVHFGPAPVTGDRCGQGGVGCCGNRLVDADELCDTFCCAADCQGFATSGSPCTDDDGNVCTDEVCDGAGTCQHLANTASCGPPPGTVFDGNWCAPRGTCAAGVCNLAPCLPPTSGSQLRIGHHNGRAEWVWHDDTGAVTAFGDPTVAVGGTEYRMCLGKSSSLGGGYLTGATPLEQWRPTAHGFRYRSAKDGNVMRAVSLRANDGRATVKTVVGFGYTVLPTSDPLMVRMIGIGPSPSCFQATYSNPKINAPGRYFARE
jgi:hypothetical protein